MIDGIFQPLSSELKYKTVKSSNLRVVNLKEIKNENSEKSWIEISNQQSNFLFPKLSMDVDSEYNGLIGLIF
jgi:hypothetical protein